VLAYTISLFSCQHETKTEGSSRTTESLAISESGIKTLTLDYGVNFENLIDLKLTEINGHDYIAFYDRITHSIYLYDYETFVLFKKIKMEKEGPNEVKNFSRFFLHTLDSIFIDSSIGIHLINSNAEVLIKKSKGSKQRNGIPMMGMDTPTFSFDNNSHFENGHIEMNIYLFKRTEDSYERATFDFQMDSIIGKSIQTKAIIQDYNEVLKVQEEANKKREMAFNILRYYARSKSYLYASTSISDSIYVFKKGELVKAFYAGKPAIEVASYSEYSTLRTIEHFEGVMNAFDNPKQSPYYKNMLISPNKRFMYRTFYHGAKPKFVEGGERALPDPIGATLIVVDLETEELYYFDLPVNEIDLPMAYSNSSFVSDEGIYFRVKPCCMVLSCTFKHGTRSSSWTPSPSRD
jgi:hypothetical protein